MKKTKWGRGFLLGNLYSSYIMGNDLLQYRFAIGSYAFARHYKSRRGASCMGKYNIVFSDYSNDLSISGLYVFYILIMSYFFPLMCGMVIDWSVTQYFAKDFIYVSYHNSTVSVYNTITLFFLSYESRCLSHFTI